MPPAALDKLAGPAFIPSSYHDYDAMTALVPTTAHYQLVPFVYKDMAAVLGAADVIVARGSATFLQEMAGMKKAVIVVPAKQ